MLVLQDAFSRALDSVSMLSNLGFEALKRHSGVWKLIPTVVSYCADIVEVKNVSAVKCGLSITRPFNRCLDTMEEFKTMCKVVLRTRLQTENVLLLVTDCQKQMNVSERTLNYLRFACKKKEN